MARKTLLIVDDSKVSRMMIRGRIQQLEPDWEVLEAGTGDEALTLIADHTPDYITMDVNMPGLSGFEAVARLRALGCNARVAMLTANIQEASRARAAELQVHFVQKPATLKAVRQALDYFRGAA